MSKKSQEKLKEIKTIYADMKLHRNHFDIKNNGKPFDNRLFPDILFLQKIEEFMFYLTHDLRPAFVENYFEEWSYRDNPLGKLLLGIDFFKIERTEEVFSIYVRLFFKAVIIFLNGYDDTAQLKHNMHIRKLTQPDVQKLNKLVTSLRKELNGLRESFVGEPDIKVEPSPKKLASQASTEAKARHKKACLYVSHLLNEYKNLVVVSIDLCLLKSHDSFYFNNDRDSYRIYLRKFFNNGRHNEALAGMVGYLGKWEFTVQKGVYARMVFFFEKKYISDDELLLLSISQYWINNITNGNGVCHYAKLTAHKPKTDSAYHKNSVLHVAYTKNFMPEIISDHVIRYFTHTDLYYHPSGLPYEDTYIKGEIRKKRSAKGSGEILE